jgi:hypothetical protein
MHRPYETTIDDVYTRPGFPHAIGRLWPPKYSSQYPASLALLTAEIHEEHRLTQVFYESKIKSPRQRLSLLSCNRLGQLHPIPQDCVFHDAHHFTKVKEALSATARTNLSGV